MLTTIRIAEFQKGVPSCVAFFVAGSAGKLRPIEPGPRSLFARSAHGFAVIDADLQALTVTFVEVDLSSPYSYTLHRSSSAAQYAGHPTRPCRAATAAVGEDLRRRGVRAPFDSRTRRV